jgi:hypothetical protein
MAKFLRRFWDEELPETPRAAVLMASASGSTSCPRSSRATADRSRRAPPTTRRSSPCGSPSRHSAPPPPLFPRAATEPACVWPNARLRGHMGADSTPRAASAITGSNGSSGRCANIERARAPGRDVEHHRHLAEVDLRLLAAGGSSKKTAGSFFCQPSTSWMAESRRSGRERLRFGQRRWRDRRRFRQCRSRDDGDCRTHGSRARRRRDFRGRGRGRGLRGRGARAERVAQ